ncbi:MAG TPA: envelope stress response membrane protein PspC [Sphingomicrobium sp.]|jgi:phage shock protein C|nr:envelope stress response membrane protein PspC [Sphingomicrobium sp.]
MAYDRHPTRQQRTNQPQVRSNQPEYHEADYPAPLDYGGQPASRTRFYRDKANGKVMGVCAGIADYTGFDVALVRICFLAAVFMSGGSVLPFYFIAGWVAPKKPLEFDYRGTEDRQFWQGVRASPARAARDIRSRFKDIDRRLADIESYVTTENRSLAREIEQLR